MYCPICFNNSLTMSSKGVIHIVINGKQLDNGRFLFNLQEETKHALMEKLITKFDEFFIWYTHLNNVDPIQYIEILSGHFSCQQHCKIAVHEKFSVVGTIYTENEVQDALEEIAKNYSVKIDLKKKAVFKVEEEK